MDGTRVSLLKTISHWIEAPPADTGRGLCIIGAAGRGKSSIGASVAQQERELKHLGADFYFTVDQQDRNEGVIPVLARQLTSWGDRRLRAEIASVVDEDRDIVQRALEVQFRKLIQVPLEMLADDPDCPPLVILLDGLDECNNDYVCRLLDLIGQSFAKLPTVVKFIITSRPEPHLLHLYHVNPMDAELEVRSLDLEQVKEVEGDIEEFLKQKLPKMVWWVKDPSKWPGEVRRRALVKLCNGLWIFAVTVTRMLADPHFRDPEKQLDALLSEASDPQRVYGRNSDLYAIYSKILHRACPPDSPPELLHLFLDALGALCVVKEPVNIHTLATLLYPDPLSNASRKNEIRTKVLGYLQEVLIVPDVDADVPSRDAEPIRFVHKSFEDYLTDRSICDTRFLVNIDEQHRRMAIRCMRRMEDLQKPNICDINPNVPIIWVGLRGFNANLGVGVVVQQHISSALQYACKNWATHVSDTSPDCDDVFASVDTFARTRLLYWLVVLSLLGVTRNVVRLVELVEVWLKARPQETRPNLSKSPTPVQAPRHRISTFTTEGFMNILAGIYLRAVAVHTRSNPLSFRALDYTGCFIAGFLPVQQPTVLSQAVTLSKEPDISALSLFQDLEMFVREFQIPIGTNPAHIYRCALALTPTHMSLSQVYGHLAESGPRPRRGCLQEWSYRNRCRCVAWSPNGQRIVSGSEDGSLRLWDPSTGNPIGERWTFHRGEVKCVAWSPDGTMIVSGANDHIIQLWDAITGTRVEEAWKGHTGYVLSLAWSPDGNRVISAAGDKTLRMWDPSTGAPIGEAWTGHAGRVYCVSWSPDGRSIASGSTRGDTRLWDSFTGAVVGELLMHGMAAVCGLTWSPDGRRIVSGNEDGTLSLWDTWNETTIGNPWEGHTSVVTCVAWSPDGKRVISGSDDSTLRLWDATTGEPVGDAWRGHTDGVYSLSWSSDGNTIVSASYNSLIMWNSTTGEPFRLEQRGPECHARDVYRVTFAHDSNNLASASSDGTLRLWDTSSGTPIGHPVRQKRTVTRLDFSPDGKCVEAEDEEYRIIWDVAGEAPGFEQRGSVSSNYVRVLEINDDGWVLDPEGKIMFLLPAALRPIGSWGRVSVKGNILAIETPSVPIIDISAYASRI
ncbi:hypothetical protein FRB94_013285 [Tulasnella sp. JGI-2019a]|nr:hypothetical protein FRB94_013285 [Tulasnella sp. JGI-2019a]